MMEHQSPVKLSTLLRQNQINSGYDLHAIKLQWLDYKNRQPQNENNPFLVATPYPSQSDEII